MFFVLACWHRLSNGAIGIGCAWRRYWLRCRLAGRNLLHLSGLIHAEPHSKMRQLLRFPRLSLCAGLVLLGMATSLTGDDTVAKGLRLVLLWIALGASYWAAFQFLFRRIYLKGQQSSEVRRPKAEVEDLSKFSTLLATTGGISIVFQQQLIYGVLIVLNIMAGIIFADFSGELYERQETDQNVTYVLLNKNYYSALRRLVTVQQFSFVAALIGLLVIKGGSP